MKPRLAMLRVMAVCAWMVGGCHARGGGVTVSESGASASSSSSSSSSSSALAPPLAPAPASPSGPFFVPNPAIKTVAILRPDAPNYRYANLDRATCEAELAQRNVPFVVGEPTPGVHAPVRLRGPLHGVSIHTDRPPKERERSVYEIFDCRLLLALDDFTALVSARDVVEMIHFNAYRPKNEYGCTAKYWGLQHCAALAIDVRELRRKDGSTLNVDRDFHGKIGLGTCAAGVGPSPATPAAEALWSFVCDAATRALFNVILTPNWNAEHKNHFHLEVTPEAGWMMVH